MNESLYLRSSLNSQRIRWWVVLVLLCAPFRVHELLAIHTASVPPQAQLFGLSQAQLSLLDAALFFALLPVVLSRINSYLPVIAYSALWLLLSVGLSSTSTDSFHVDLRGDAMPEGVRLLLYSLGWLYLLIESRGVDGEGLVNAGAVLTVVSVCLSPFFLVGSELGRSPLLGFEVTSSGFVAGAVVLATLSVPAIPLQTRVISSVAAVLALGLSGSRAALLVTGACAVFAAARNKNVLRVDWRFWALFVAAAGAALLLSPAGERLSAGADIEKPEYQALAETAVPGSLSLAVDVSSGRVAAWVAAGILIVEHFPYGLGTDWRAQEHLQSVGYPSHSHSAIAQLLLRFGILAIVPWAVWLRGLVRARARASWSMYPMLVLVLGCVADYWLFVPKAHGLLLALSVFAPAIGSVGAVSEPTNAYE